MGMTLQQLQQEGATPLQGSLQGSSSSAPTGQKLTLAQLQTEGATPINSGTQNSSPSGSPSFLQDESNDWGKVWNEATHQQDLYSPQIGGGAAAKGLILDPVKHAVKGALGTLSQLPVISDVGNLFNVGVNALSQSPIHQKVVAPLLKGVQDRFNNFSSQYPRQSEALGGDLNMVNAGITTAVIGQGISSVKNLAQTHNLINALTQGGVKDAENVAQTLTENGAVPELGETINAGTAKKILSNAYDDALGAATEGTPTAEAIANVDRLKSALTALERINGLPYVKDLIGAGGQLAGNVLRSVGNAARTVGSGALQGLGIGGGAGGLLYPLARYEGWIK